MNNKIVMLHLVFLFYLAIYFFVYLLIFVAFFDTGLHYVALSVLELAL